MTYRQIVSVSTAIFKFSQSEIEKLVVQAKNKNKALGADPDGHI